MTYALPQADPTSVVGRRIGAWFIDLAIYLLIGMAIGLAFGSSTAESREFPTSSSGEAFCDTWREDNSGFCFATTADGTTTVTSLETKAVSLSWFPLHFVLYSVLQGVTGASLGKMALGLRVVTADGRRCGVGRSFLRTLAWIADAITCGLPVVGGICLLTTKGHRRVGDLLAKTYVVPKAHEGHPVVVPGLTAPWPAAGPGGPGQSAGWPTGPSASQGWAGPTASGQAGTWAPSASTTAEAPSADGPTWDAVRNAYIQYDREQGAWVQWDDAARAWRPIDQ